VRLTLTLTLTLNLTLTLTLTLTVTLMLTLVTFKWGCLPLCDLVCTCLGKIGARANRQLRGTELLTIRCRRPEHVWLLSFDGAGTCSARHALNASA